MRQHILAFSNGDLGEDFLGRGGVPPGACGPRLPCLGDLVVGNHFCTSRFKQGICSHSRCGLESLRCRRSLSRSW